MVVFKPDKALRKKFPNIDFEVLSSVYSLICNSLDKRKKKSYFIVHLILREGDYSYYNWQTGTIVDLFLSDYIKTEANFHATLLHEFRHFIQDRIFNIPLTKKNYSEKTYKMYIQCPIEVDARKFEKKFSNKIMRLYNRLKKCKEDVKYNGGYKGKKI